MNGYLRGKPDTSWWVSQMREGIAFRKKAAMQGQWNAWRAYYRGHWLPGTFPSNVFFKLTRTIVPRIYFRNPSVSVTAKKPGPLHMAFAKLLERIDNKMLRQMKLKREMKSIVQDAFMFGTGIGKLGYGSLYQPAPIPGEEANRTSKDGELFEYDATILENMPWYRRVHPSDFIVPEGTIVLRDARWCAEWTRRPLEDVRDDPNLKNAKDLKAGNRTSIDDTARAFGIVQREDMIDLVEIHDKKTRRVFILAPYATTKVLFQEDDTLSVNGEFNYDELVFNEDDERMWGIPDSNMLEPIQLGLNEMRTLQMKHARLSLARILAKIKSIDPEEVAKIVSGEVNPVVWIKGDPNTAIKSMEASDIPDGLLKGENILVQDMRETIGFGRNQMGEFAEGSADRTAHEAEIVRMASEIRVDERRDMVADVLVNLVERMHPIIFQHWKQEQVIDVAGPNGIPIWVRFKPEVLRAGRYDVKVDPDSSLPETKALREQKALQLYQVFAPNPLVDPVQLTQYLLHEMHGTAFDTMLRSQGSLGSQGNPMDLSQFAGTFGSQEEG